MTFKEWLEAYTLSPSTKKYLNLEDQFTITQEIEGWTVYFVDYINSQKAKQQGGFYQNWIAPIWRNLVFKFKSYVQKDVPVIKEALSHLQGLGLNKSFNVPIVVYYLWKEQGTNQLGHAQIGGLKKDEVVVAKPFSPPPNTSYVQAHIVVWRNEKIDPKKMIHTIAHEIAHHVYAALNPQQKQHIMQLAYKEKAPTPYGATTGGSTIHHASGNEWFAEMISTIMIYDNPEKRGLLKRALNWVGIGRSPWDDVTTKGLLGMVRSVNTPSTAGASQMYDPIQPLLQKYRKRKW